MPGFTDPFYGNLPSEKLTLDELIRAIRLDVAAEEEATALYEAHAYATDNPVARKVLLDVANEERVHVGEFVRLLNILTSGQEQEWMQNGYNEVDEMAEEVMRGDLEPATPAEKAEDEGTEAPGNNNGGAGADTLTIGSLKNR